MKNHSFFIFATTIILILSFLTMSGCEKQQNKDSSNIQMLVVEQQHSKIDNIERNTDHHFEVNVEVPIRGPEPLIDSVMAFLNNKLHYYYELVIDTPFPDSTELYSAEQAYIDDPSLLIYAYTEKYRKTIEERLSYLFNLNLILIAQTESFVTYGLEWYSANNKSGSRFLCYTFSKKDGRLINTLVKEKKLLSFIKKLPKDKQLFPKNQLEHLRFGDYDVALLEKGLLVVNNKHSYYIVDLFKYTDILPILSNEAKRLVRTMGDSTQNCHNDYFAGERLGRVQTHNGETIILTEALFHNVWSGSFFEEIDYYSWSSNGDSTAIYPDLMAFYAGKGKGYAAPVIDGDTGRIELWDRMSSTNHSGNIYAFDSKENTLYIPFVENVMMGEHNCYDKYVVYKFNGFEFVPQREEGGFWLHPSLRQFGRLCYMGGSGDYLVRVDELRIYDDRYDDQHNAALADTCRFRYAAWKNKDSMEEEPDLVIHNGYYIKGSGCYVFHDKGYQYVVDCPNEQLTISKNGKTIMQIYIPDEVVYWYNCTCDTNP